MAFAVGWELVATHHDCEESHPGAAVTSQLRKDFCSYSSFYDLLDSLFDADSTRHNRLTFHEFAREISLGLSADKAQDCGA